MALEFGFYDSYNHDRLYNAENMNDIFEGVLTDGVYAGVGNEFHVKPSIGLQVTVDTGRAWFKSTWNKNRSMAPVNFDQPDPVYDRIDTLCIRVQKSILERRNDFFVYKGAILTNPQPPIIQETEDTFYLPLANVTIRAQAEEIKVSDIEILVGRERCPYVTSILQQTDITDLFARWEGQFTEWWDGIKDILTRLEEGDVGAIFSMIEEKVNKSDKATDEDIALQSDRTWMTPKGTKSMIDSATKELSDTLKNGVVSSFKGRIGAVTPESGDYTATQVGALPIGGGTLTGALTVNGGGLTVTGGNVVIGNSSTNRSLTVNGAGTFTGNISVTGTSTFNSTVTFKGAVRLQNGNYGSTLNFGDGDFVCISEPSDDKLEIKANSINFVTNTGSSNLTHNGNPLGGFSPILLTSGNGSAVSGTVTSNGEWTSSVFSIPTSASWLFFIVTNGQTTRSHSAIVPASLILNPVTYVDIMTVHRAQNTSTGVLYAALTVDVRFTSATGFYFRSYAAISNPPGFRYFVYYV